MDAPPSRLLSVVEAIAGGRVTAARKAQGGYTAADRWVLEVDGACSVFAKGAFDVPQSPMATWLRNEARAYATISGPFMPRFIGWQDDPEYPVVILEDLSHATSPPPWDAHRVASLLDGLGAVAATSAPAWATNLVERRDHLLGWERVQADPRPFLALGVASEAWLRACLDTMRDAARAAPLDGDALVHADVRSDNLCFVVDGAHPDMRLIDWNNLGRGSELFDLAAVAPSIEREGGPKPWELLPDSRGLAAVVAGYFAAQAGLPAIHAAPFARAVQLDQLRSALPWAARELDLPPPDGRRPPRENRGGRLRRS